MPFIPAIPVVWSEIGVPDESADGTGSWLVVGTGGSGVWRGEATW